MSYDGELLKKLAAIRDEPGDDRLRLQLADWLDQQGDSRGEWIRLQCFDDLSDQHPLVQNWVAQFDQFEVDERDRRQDELLQAHRSEWLGNPPLGVEVEPHAGMLRVQLPCEVLPEIDAAASWLREQKPWIETMLLMEFDQEQHYNLLAEAGLLDQISTLHLDPIGLSRCPSFLGKLTQLRSLYLYGDSVTDEWIEQIANLYGLQSLELVGCSSFHGEGLFAAKSLQKLRRLSIQGGLFELRGLEGLTQLEQLKVKYQGEKTVSGIGGQLCRAVGRLGSLKELHIGDCEKQAVGNAGLREFSGLQQLTSLSLEIAADANVQSLSAIPNLETLKLTGPGMTDDQLANLAQIASLRHVAIWSNELSGAGLPELSRLDRLETLKHPALRVLSPRMNAFSGRRLFLNLQLTGDLITDESLKFLPGIPQLSELDLLETSVTGAGLSFLVDLPLLESLAVRLEQLQSARPEDLRRWTSLRRLHISGRRSSGASLKPLTHLRELSRVSVSLELPYGKFDESELAHLAGMSQLRLLDLSVCRPITDAGLEHLAEVTNLQQLNLNGAEATEQGLRFLRHMRDMRDLNLG